MGPEKRLSGLAMFGFGNEGVEKLNLDQIEEDYAGVPGSQNDVETGEYNNTLLYKAERFVVLCECVCTTQCL